MRHKHVPRLRYAITVVAIWLTATSLSAQAQPDAATAAAAENYVHAQMEKGLAILNDRSISVAKRHANLQAFLESFMDIRRVALFSLGMARRSATPQQTEQFVDAFRAYVVADLESLLRSYYAGQAAHITGCSQDGPNSYRVEIALENRPTTGQYSGNQPIDLFVQVLNENGKFVITDLAALGVWLSVHERDEVNEYLMETNGNFGGLLMRYRLRAERRQSDLPEESR